MGNKIIQPNHSRSPAEPCVSNVHAAHSPFCHVPGLGIHQACVLGLFPPTATTAQLREHADVASIEWGSCGIVLSIQSVVSYYCSIHKRVGSLMPIEHVCLNDSNTQVACRRIQRHHMRGIVVSYPMPPLHRHNPKLRPENGLSTPYPEQISQ